MHSQCERHDAWQDTWLLVKPLQAALSPKPCADPIKDVMLTSMPSYAATHRGSAATHPTEPFPERRGPKAGMTGNRRSDEGKPKKRGRGAARGRGGNRGRGKGRGTDDRVTKDF